MTKQNIGPVLRKVLALRLNKLIKFTHSEPHLDPWLQGYVDGQKEVYEELIQILDGDIIILEPRK